MNLFGLLDVSASALAAERIRAELTTVNMANAETTRTAAGGPYRRQQVVFQATAAQDRRSFGGLLALQSGFQGSGSLLSTSLQPGLLHRDLTPPGVQIAAVVSDPSEPIKRYDPQHPDADKEGFVSFPDINPLTEMVDLMGASRAYGLNSSAIQATKGMIASSLDILK